MEDTGENSRLIDGKNIFIKEFFSLFSTFLKVGLKSFALSFGRLIDGPNLQHRMFLRLSLIQENVI